MDTREEVKEVFVAMTKELHRLVVLRVDGALGPEAGEKDIMGQSDAIWGGCQPSSDATSKQEAFVSMSVTRSHRSCGFIITT